MSREPKWSLVEEEPIDLGLFSNKEPKVSAGYLDAVKEAWKKRIAGAHNAWRTPIMLANDKIELIQMTPDLVPSEIVTMLDLISHTDPGCVCMGCGYARRWRSYRVNRGAGAAVTVTDLKAFGVIS